MERHPLPGMDKGFILLQAIEQDGDVSQRELSERTGLSLGSVNLLLQKMMREGLIRIKAIPANRVLYMLTPQGMLEKANKTVHYIQRHYQIIESTKAMIASQLKAYHQLYDTLFVCLPGNELDELIEQVVQTYSGHHGKTINLLQGGVPNQIESKNTILLRVPTDNTRLQQMAGWLPIPQASLFDRPSQ